MPRLVYYHSFLFQFLRQGDLIFNLLKTEMTVFYLYAKRYSFSTFLEFGRPNLESQNRYTDLKSALDQPLNYDIKKYCPPDFEISKWAGG